MALCRPEPSWQRESNTSKQIIADPLAVIYNEGQWRISRVSPLYNLQYEGVKLKQYATKIRQAVVSTISSHSTIKYSVLCEEQGLLKYTEDDSSGLMITISSTQENNSKPKVVYLAVLLSWGLYSKLDNATHLPYMLERGEQKISTAVKSTLQTMFDCNIKQFSFTQIQLLQFGLNFLDYDTSRTDETFTLVYKTPQCEHKDKLSLSFDISDVKIIWNGVKNEVTKESDLVNTAYHILQNQIFHMISLDISVLELCEVVTSKADVKSNGMVKMKTPEFVNCYFTMLNNISNVDIVTDLYETPS